MVFDLRDPSILVDSSQDMPRFFRHTDGTVYALIRADPRNNCLGFMQCKSSLLGYLLPQTQSDHLPFIKVTVFV